MFDTAKIQRIFETRIKQMKDLNYFNNLKKSIVIVYK